MWEHLINRMSESIERDPRSYFWITKKCLFLCLSLMCVTVVVTKRLYEIFHTGFGRKISVEPLTTIEVRTTQFYHIF